MQLTLHAIVINSVCAPRLFTLRVACEIQVRFTWLVLLQWTTTLWRGPRFWLYTKRMQRANNKKIHKSASYNFFLLIGWGWCSCSELTSDVVETESSKIWRLEIWNSRQRLKICTFCQIFFINIASEANCFQISGTFLTRFGCFLSANTTNQKSTNYRNCNIHIISSQYSKSRGMQPSRRNSDSQKLVSRLHHCN